MLKSQQQLTLRFGLQEEATFANFFAGANAQLIYALQNAVLGTGENIIYLYATPGEGRSHLLQACCHYAYQYQRTSVYLPFAQLKSLSTEILFGLENMDVVAMDDIQSIAGQTHWEEAVFHLFNRLYDAKKSIIIASEQLPKFLNLTLQDLTSRLAWGICYPLQGLRDDEKLTVLIQRAQERGMTLAPEVAKFILTHCQRNMTVLSAILNQLDKASLAAQRRLTIPFVKEVLEV